MPKRNIVHVEIPTRNVDESGKFYAELFGWKITTDTQMDYTMWEPEKMPGGGFSPKASKSRSGNS
ncbi:MAG: VOC family protein [Chloroflexota bacterium]